MGAARRPARGRCFAMAAPFPPPARSAAIRAPARARRPGAGAALPVLLALTWLAALLPPTSAPAAPPAGSAVAPVPPESGSVYALLGQLPLSFIANAGQGDPSVHFQVRAPG